MYTEINTARVGGLVAAPRGKTDPDAPSSNYLIVLGTGEHPIAMHRIGPEGTLVGRSVESGLQLAMPSVSRNHAFLSLDDEGCVRLTDLGSTNGSFVNGDRVAPHDPTPLVAGDRLQFGESPDVKYLRLAPDEERFHLSLFDRAVRDGLTGLHNRAYFLDRIALLAQACPASAYGVAVILLDIDRFKAVNDEHGHDAGDAVLRAVGPVLQGSTRAGDLIARYGGEEFIVGLAIRSGGFAESVAGRIRANLASRPIESAGKALRVTASLGVAFAPPGRPAEVRRLIAQADRRLYRAKQEGRDRVIGPG